MPARGQRQLPRAGVVADVSRWTATVCAAVALVFGLAAWSGCAGDGPSVGTTAVPTPTPTPGSSDTYAQIQREVFDVHCLSAGCHNAVSPAAELVLEAGVSYDDLVDVAPTNPIAAAQGLLRVTPGAPEQSYLYVKLSAAGGVLGSRMPLGQPPLAAAEIELVRSWIRDGAPAPSVAAAAGH